MDIDGRVPDRHKLCIVSKHSCCSDYDIEKDQTQTKGINMDVSAKQNVCCSSQTSREYVKERFPAAMFKHRWRKYVVIMINIAAVLFLFFLYRSSLWSLVRTKPSQVEHFENDVIINHVTYINQSKSNINLQQILTANDANAKGINLVDALWTIKPAIGNRQNSQNGKVSSLIDAVTQQPNDALSETDSNEPDRASKSSNNGRGSKTTSLYTTEGVTNPITTQSITTPIYTEAATDSVTTESITTPIMTEPVGMEEITTEADPNDMRILLRHRRGANPTQTTPSSVTTSVAVSTPQCVAPAYLSNGNACQCPLGSHGGECQSQLSASERALQRGSTITFSSSMNGQYNNDTRADFQAQLEAQYANTTGFVRVYVHPMSYNSTSNTTELTYDVIYDSPVNARLQSQSAGMTTRITDHTLPIIINGQAVDFNPNDTFLVQELGNGDLRRVSLGDQTIQDPCQLYNDIDACNSATGGRCIVRGNNPRCVCTGNMYGEFCGNEKLYAADDVSDILAVLLPALGGAIAAMAAALFFVYCCIRKKAKRLREPVIHDVPSTFFRLPRFRRMAPGVKYFDPGTYGDAHSTSGEFYSQASAASEATEEEDMSTHPSQVSQNSLLPRLVRDSPRNDRFYRNGGPNGFRDHRHNYF